jgi:hypothetical protein
VKEKRRVKTLELPIEEYFKYHPPTTTIRIALHDRVNRESLEIYKALKTSEHYSHWLCIRDAAMLLAADVCHDETCLSWAKSTIDRLMDAYFIANTDSRSIAILMNIQQFRMFLNQRIVVDELKQQQAAVTSVDIGTISEVCRFEAIPKSNDTQGFDITPLQFVDRTKELIDRLERTIHLTLDGNKWCALTGENLQVGIAGFGDDPIAALTDLYTSLKGIEFVELKNSSGDIYSTSIKSISLDPEAIEKHQDFIRAYGDAIANLDVNGLSSRETLIAELIAAEDEEIVGGA